MNEHLSVEPLERALTSGRAMFGRSRVVKRKPNASAALDREIARMRKIFSAFPEVSVGPDGWEHEADGRTFARLSLQSRDFMVNCVGAYDRVERGESLDIIAGSCLFGEQSITGQAAGRRYSLTDPSTLEHLSAPILHLDIDERLHIYEVETAARLGSFIGQLADQIGGPVKVHFHSPVPEYTLYGLSLFNRGIISRDEYRRYRGAVERRGPLVQSLVREHLQSSDVEIVFHSPLDWLVDGGLPDGQERHLEADMFAAVARRDELWGELTRSVREPTLLGLNHLSYSYLYLDLAKQCRTAGRRLVLVENPEEWPILVRARRTIPGAERVLENVTGFYVHPKLCVREREFADDEFGLYNARDGFDPGAIELAVSMYGPSVGRG